MTRTDWASILAHAASIVRSYDTEVTLRQCFYRLVSDATIPNTTGAYKTLSSKTAEARREGWFPSFIDNTRKIHRYRSFTDPEQARQWLASIYRLDRTKGQDVSLYLGVEKRGMVEQLAQWFGEPLGIPILPLGGYSSQTYVDDVARDSRCSGRKAILLYGGDFDPSGEDIDRDFVYRSDCFAEVIRVALSAGQVAEYNLPPQPGKSTDSRAAGFIARHGELVQVELDALAPTDLRDLYQEAIDRFWDGDAHQAALRQEAIDRQELVDKNESDED